MPPQRTKTVRFSTAVPSPNAHPVPPTNNHSALPWGTRIPHFAQQGMKHASARTEILLTQIHAECNELLRSSYKMKAMLQKGKEEKAELEAQMQYQNYCLQAAEQRAWGLEELVNKLEVELASQKAETPSTDQRGHQ